MRRREFLSLVGSATAWPLAARAQPSRFAVIGVLSPESSSTGDIQGLREGLRDLGYVEGRNIRFEYRWSAGDFSRLPDMAAELVAMKVDVLDTSLSSSQKSNQLNSHRDGRCRGSGERRANQLAGSSWRQYNR